MSASEDIRETVRRRYVAAATRSAAGDQDGAIVVETSCCGPTPVATTDERGRVVFGAELYGAEAQGAPDDAVAASLGCGVPTAVADLHPGEVDLDLGSGAGADVLISARRVAPGGRAIGLDMRRSSEVDQDQYSMIVEQFINPGYLRSKTPSSRVGAGSRF